MDLAGLVDSIITATASIDSGRKGFAIRSKAHKFISLFYLLSLNRVEYQVHTSYT